MTKRKWIHFGTTKGDGRRGRLATLLGGIGVLAVLSGCGGGQAPAGGGEATPQSAGQVASPSAAPKVTHYAASRFAEQASFGPTPALVAEIRAKGFEKWIDEQMALPQAPISFEGAEELYKYPQNPPPPIPNRLQAYVNLEVTHKALSAPDQLRWRVMYSLSNYIVAAGDHAVAQTPFVNLLYQRSFGNYRDLLRDVTLNRHMGSFLNNDQNRPKSAECTFCSPNENYARELMQLFSIGVFKLNPDGTPQRDGRGRLIETYTQEDVEELARALTGWMTDPNPPNRPPPNSRNLAKPMVPSTWAPERDSGRKVVMGTVFPAGQKTEKDLDDIVAMLMAHPNIAPFVALRLIQHLVMSDPSPSYVGRVAGAFRDNGAGVAGDMKAALKAVLLDPEARRGDSPQSARPSDGKIREPFLHSMALFRGMGCGTFITYAPDSYWQSSTQRFLQQQNVFGYYAPTDRAPGSNLLAPEQRLLDARELTTRLNLSNSLRWNRTALVNDMSPLLGAGCNAMLFVDAYKRSSKEFLDLLSERFFRGAMPATLRNNMEQMIKAPSWNAADPSEGAMRMLDFALATPYYGAIK